VNRLLFPKILASLAVALVIGVAVVGWQFLQKVKWQRELELALLHDSMPLQDDQTLMEAAIVECSRTTSAQQQARILIWATLHFDPRNAHASESLIETAAYECRSEYVAEAKQILNSAQSSMISPSQRKTLADFADTIESISAVPNKRR
jgi:hypothetical protein